jgi:SAM-dependent methyltransferase
MAFVAIAERSDVSLSGRIKECANLVGAGDKLLDVGCGPGWLAQVALSRGYRRYVGVDRSLRVSADGVKPNYSFVEGSLFKLPFSDGLFDAVCLFDVIEHVPRHSEKQALEEIARVIRTDGKLYLSTPHASPLHTLLDPTWLALRHRHYRRATIRLLLRSAGFRVERMFVAGGLVECLDYIRLLFYMHVLKSPMPSIDVVAKYIEQSHGSDHTLGMTVFVVASKNA